LYRLPGKKISVCVVVRGKGEAACSSLDRFRNVKENRREYISKVVDIGRPAILAA
jgi:hypothetical protein